MAASQTTPSPSTTSPATMESLFLRLFLRTSQGFNQDVYRRARSLGWDAYVDWQLAPDAIPDTVSDQWLAQFPSLTMTPKQLVENYGDLDLIKNELRWSACLRSLFSLRSLQERTVEFWNDHFSQDPDDSNIGGFLRTTDDREVIRAHALGTFPDLLWASMHSPSMLRYLDNYTNSKDGPQENYARELLELHTLGVDGGYTETDVKEVARCLTGWRYVVSFSSSNWGTFFYQDIVHDQGPKQVLGVSIPANGGQADGQILHQILATHPSTAKHIARKLCRWFLVYEPAQSLVDEVAQIYTQTAGSIPAMLRHILRPQSFEDAQPALNPKLKRPFAFGVGLMRALAVRVTDTNTLHLHFKAMGQEPFDWPAPNGYPDSPGAWGSTLLPRWNFATQLLDGGLSGLSVDQSFVEDYLLGGASVPASELPERIDAVLTGGTLSSKDRDLLRRFILRSPSVDWSAKREAIALAASLPSYQLY